MKAAPAPSRRPPPSGGPSPASRALLLAAILVAGCSSPAPAVPSPTPLATSTAPAASPTPLETALPSPSLDVPPMTTIEPSAVIPVPGSGGAINLTTDGSNVWVAATGSILRIDAALNAVTSLPGPSKRDDTTIAFASDGLWLTRWQGGTLYRLDPTTGAELLSAVMPAAVSIAFIGDELWVGREDERAMVLVDRTTGAQVRTVKGSAYARPGAGSFWLAAGGPPRIDRLDPATGALQARFSATGESNCSLGGAFPDDVWVSCFGRDVQPRFASRIDPATNSVAAVAALPPCHGGTVILIDGRAWFVGTFEDASGAPFGALLRLDRTGRIDRFISFGSADPDSPVLAGGALWVPDEAANRLLRVDLDDLD